MKKRSDGVDIDTDKGISGEKYSIFGYIALLFTVTLLLILLSWFIHQRNQASEMSGAQPESMCFQTDVEAINMKL
ncbi:MAG: hypothetical protein GX254_09360 [Clostridiales bacterium]|jgi:hypothetical protein|nr:hypothetical protein [Clostridiales bacterium]